VILRIQCKDGFLLFSVSRNNKEFEKIPLQVRRSSLGKDLRMGLQVSKSSWSQYNALSPARFSYLRQEVSGPSPYR